MHIRRTQLFAAPFHSLVLFQRDGTSKPLRFTEALFPHVLIPRVPGGESLCVVKGGGVICLTSVTWDAHCKITPVIGTELNECKFLSGLM